MARSCGESESDAALMEVDLGVDAEVREDAGVENDSAMGFIVINERPAVRSGCAQTAHAPAPAPLLWGLLLLGALRRRA
jgi:MYXO-CTERM domain-containing protein